MRYYYIYKITLLKGTLKNHYYFGQHITDNINDNYAGSGTLLITYYNKYGKIENETYIKEIISFHHSTEELNIAEANIIGDKYKSDKMCINLCAGGRRPGYSDEFRKKLSESHKGKTPWNKGKHLSEEQKQQISKLKQGNKYHLGHKLSEEQKHNVSIGTIIAMSNPEVRVKISKAKKGKKLSEETKKKMSESHRGKKLSEEAKKKLSDFLTGKHYKIINHKRIYI